MERCDWSKDNGLLQEYHDIIEDRLRKLTSKCYPTSEEVEEEMTSPSFNHVQMFAIQIEHMTGKLVNEK